MKKIIILLFAFLSILEVEAQQNMTKPETKATDNFNELLKYRNIGPFRGGRSVTASGVKGDPMTYYMGITGGGLWKTEDAGQFWTNISDGYFKTGSVGAVAVSESDPNVIYCGMGEHAPRGVMTHHGDGVYKSIDAGKTWTHLGLEATQHISRIEIHPTNPDIAYVAAQGALYSKSKERGIYKTTDGGKTWTNTLFVDEGTGAVELSMDMNHPHILYAAMWEHQRVPWKVISGGPGSGLYKSVDSGATWKKIHKGLPKEKGKMAISVSPANSDKVYALIESDSDKDQGGLFVSNNAGESWTLVSGDNRLTQRAWYYIEVFTDPQNENMVYVLSAPALRSIDGGKTWSRITGTHGDYHDLWINPDNPKNLCIANDGGAAISFNRGRTWSRQDNMPTAQFYRVNVDNAVPYNIYGGQQDNTSVKIASRSISRQGITTSHWEASAGGESAFLAFDPDNPRYVMGGSYLGTINLLDTEAKAGTKVMAAPNQYLGEPARDMKYLYNWNAPIIWSKHEPGTFYHGAQYLLRTRDMGKSWEEVSPDLTRNQDDKQGNGGGPYTNEAVGAENYGTLSYVIESPHEKGVIYTGSDDGYVQITKDGGENWTNITPKGLAECLINAIEVSPHDPATVYIATTRYKFNDHRPGLYKSTNYGKTWKKINTGIPNNAFTRVVREDETQKGLLFAGTELGMYMSRDDGQNWEAFQLNLPVTPILDMKIRHDDLIVGTSGRSFWILDDLSLVRQHSKANPVVTLYKPDAAMLTNGGSPLNGTSKKFKGTHPLYGINPATGVVLYYQLPKAEKQGAIKLTIKDADGNVIRTISSEKDKTFKPWAGGPPAEPTLMKESGLNRFVWDMKHKTMPGVPGVYIESNFRGHKVSPGTYTLTLEQGTASSTQTVEILANPKYPTDAATYAEYDGFMKVMEAEATNMHNMINTLHDLQQKITAITSNLSDEKTALKIDGEALVKKIKAWDGKMIQRKSKAYDDVENFRNGFTANYLFLINQTESAIPRVNRPNIDRKKELDAKWAVLKKEGMDLLKTAIPAYNQRLWDAGIGAIWEKD